MKNLIFTFLLLSTACYHSKPTTDDYRGKVDGLISFKVWNNSVLPHQYTLIGYNPGEKDRSNWSNGLFLWPGVHHRFTCPAGTKIYVANKKQADTVMGGGSIRTDTPFIVVKKEDAGRSFKLN